jgi:hypothetical protein
MTDWYKSKMESAHKQWEVACESGKDKAAKHHMDNYLNYKSMLDSANITRSK